MSNLRTSEMERTTQGANSDLVMTSQVDETQESGYITKAQSVSTLGVTIVTKVEYASELETSSKTITAAINSLLHLIADNYDSTIIYNSGDVVIHDGLLYECNSNNVTGTWDNQLWDSRKIVDLI